MSSRGLTGTQKPRPINVNSVYQGRNTVNGGRAAGPLGNKNALQTLGKPASVVRRMPPPATLPSLKAEHGHDSGINLVSQSGGQGWNKSIDSANDTKNQSADNSSIPSSGAPDLRPTWAKSASGGSLESPLAAASNQSQLQRKPGQLSVASAANNREFPTLAASLAPANKQPTVVPAQVNVVESQKVQLQQRQIHPKGTPIGLENQEEPIIPVQPPPSSGSSYIGASIRIDTNRKLPDRYYGGAAETRSNTQRRYDVRQKLAQLSMESKDSPSTPTEKTSSQSTDRQSSVPVVEENLEAESQVNPTSHPQQFQSPSPLSSALPPLMQKESTQVRGYPETRSQDVRQFYGQSQQQIPPAQPLNELPEMAAWNRAAATGGSGNDYPTQYRNDVQSPNVPPQILHGRGDIGQAYRGPPAGSQRGPPRLGTTQHPPPQRQRYEYVQDDNHPPSLMSQRFSNNSWEDCGNSQNWNMPMSDEVQRRPSANRSNYRGNSRGNSESESGWNSQQPPLSAPHQRRNDSNWNYPVNEYDNYHRGQTAPVSNRSRTTSNSYGEEYEQGVYAPYLGDNERRYKNRPKQPIEGPQNYDYEYSEERPYNDYEMHQQQPAYRMLKRNDEKSAEYFKAAPLDSEQAEDESLTLSQLTRVGRVSKPLNFGSINSDSAEIASSDTFDSSLEQRKTPLSGQQKFNRAPGSGKNERQSENTSQHSTQKANVPPAENVWKKRMEEQQLKQQEDKVTWQHIKQHRKFDYHFPAISDKKTDSSEETEPLPLVPAPPATHPTRSQHKQPLQRNSSANQRAPTKWDDQQSWNEEPAVDVTNEDDTYEGTRREFFNNRQRAPRTQPLQVVQRVQKPVVQEVVDSQRRPTQQPLLRRKRNEPEDNFSNMGEFHAEDYKIEEMRAPAKSRYDNGFDGKSQNEERGGRQNLARKTMNSDERNRQLKPQRASGARTVWQRQPLNKVEESNVEGESVLDSERPQRSSNPRNQRNNQTGGQNRTQQPTRRNNNRNGKGLTPQSNEQGKQIKSPARSENGVDEWETASESSGRKPETNRKAPQPRPKNREKTPRETNGTTKSNTFSNDGQQQSKNAKPASHTFQNREEFVKNKSELNSQPQQHKNTNESSKKYARESLSSKEKSNYFHSKTTVRDGLAGVDINDASVVIIDQTPNIGFDSTASEDGEFEEVISRKVKRQRQVQQQQEEERASRERQKLEQRQRLREEKRKPNKKNSTSTNTSKQSQQFTEEIHQIEPIAKLSSLSPLSASDSGVAAISSTSPPQLEMEQSSLQSLVNVSIPAQHPVWNSPSPQVAKGGLAEEEPEPTPQTAAVGPIARPKQRIDGVIPAFGKKEGSNYSFGYEHPMNENDELQEKLANLKGIWPGEDAYISNNNLFNQPIKSTPQEVTSKLGHQLSDESQKSVAVDRELSALHEEADRSKSRSSVNRQFSSNSQSPLNTSAALFNSHNNSIYPQSSTAHYNPISNYSMLLSETNGRDFLNGPPFTSSPPSSQAFAGTHSFGAFANPAKIYVASGGSSNDWPTSNADLLSINSPSPLLPNNAFNNVTTSVPLNVPPPCFTTIPPPKFQPVQPMPLNHNVPPPPIGKFAPNFPDFRFPPPQRSNFNPPNTRNPPSFNNGNRSQRRSSHTSNNGRQNSSPALPLVHLWNGNMNSNQQQTFGLF